MTKTAIQKYNERKFRSMFRVAHLRRTRSGKLVAVKSAR